MIPADGISELENTQNMKLATIKSSFLQTCSEKPKALFMVQFPTNKVWIYKKNSLNLKVQMCKEILAKATIFH